VIDKIKVVVVYLPVLSIPTTTYVVSSIPHPHHLRCQFNPSSPPLTLPVRSIIPTTYVVSSIPHPHHLRCQFDPSSPPHTLSARSFIPTTYVVSSIPHLNHLRCQFDPSPPTTTPPLLYSYINASHQDCSYGDSHNLTEVLSKWPKDPYTYPHLSFKYYLLSFSTSGGNLYAVKVTCQEPDRPFDTRAIIVL
jgi:hypothetical protein